MGSDLTGANLSNAILEETAMQSTAPIWKMLRCFLLVLVGLNLQELFSVILLLKRVTLSVNPNILTKLKPRLFNLVEKDSVVCLLIPSILLQSVKSQLRSAIDSDRHERKHQGVHTLTHIF